MFSNDNNRARQVEQQAQPVMPYLKDPDGSMVNLWLAEGEATRKGRPFLAAIRHRQRMYACAALEIANAVDDAYHEAGIWSGDNGIDGDERWSMYWGGDE